MQLRYAQLLELTRPTMAERGIKKWRTDIALLHKGSSTLFFADTCRVDHFREVRSLENHGRRDAKAQ